MQIFQVLLNVNRMFVQVSNYFLKHLKRFLEFGVLGFDLLLMLFELCLDVLNYFAEVLVIKN